MKKYDFSMKKYDFLPSRPPLQDFCKKAQWRAKKQDFCKNAQWRAKKLRERGSNTARPTEKGGGGSHDWVAIRSIRSISARRFGRDWVAIRSIRSISVVSIWSAACVAIRSIRRVDLECCLCRDSVDSVDFGASKP